MVSKLKRKCAEGIKAKENFDRTMTALFRVPKSVVTEKIKANRKKGKD